MIGSQDLIVGLVVAVFFFGAKKLPELAGSLGKSMKEFKKAVAGDATDEEPAGPATSAVAAQASVACAGCQMAMRPEWTHCPQCGAAAPGAKTPA